MKIFKDNSSHGQNQINIIVVIFKKLIMIMAFVLPIYGYILLSNIDSNNQLMVFSYIKNMGNWAINALFIVIFSGPIYKLLKDNHTIIKFKIDKALKFLLDIRPELGFFMGALAISHGVFIILSRIKTNLWMWPTDFSYFGTWGLWSGVIATIILVPMFLTSNRWAIGKLGPIWFKIHSMIIWVVVFGVFHSEIMGAKTDGLESLIPFIIIVAVYFIVRYFANKKNVK